MPRQARNSWDVKLSADQRDELGQWLTRELDNALGSRTASEAEVAYWHVLYEQGRTRSAQNAPWADAADLTSAIGTEKVDALRARIVKTIFVDPVVTVEGWGDAEAKAPFVEAFHQWQVETTGFQAALAKAVHLSLIEPHGVIEVYEDVGRRPVRKRIKAALQLAPDGTALLGPDFQPLLERKPDGSYITVQDVPNAPPETQPPSAEVVIDDYELVARGPRYRTIPSRDFLVLPGHARERSEIWGYAKRFYRRVSQLQERARDGVYDAEVVDGLGTGDERLYASPTNAGGTTLAGESLDIPSQEADLAEKELFEITFLKEFDKTGYRWYVATLHKATGALLRLQYDDIGRPRYFCLVPFPRPDFALDGYSFIGHKLITTIEENTAWRNMLADRAALQLQAPILRKQNALWDPDNEPLGPRAVWTVREMDEIQAFTIPDVTNPARERIIDTERQAEKLGGMTDVASGSKPSETRTLGETRLVTAFSEVRIEEVIRNIQETVEEMFQVINLLWIRALTEMDEGMESPSHVLQGLELRGADVASMLPNKRYAATVLEGAFRFKPRGSVEATDRHQQRADFSESITALGALGSVAPLIMMVIQQPDAATALLETWAQLYNVRDKKAFLGQEAMQGATQQIQMAAQAQQMAEGGAMPQGSEEPAPANNPASGLINPAAQLPQERMGVM